MKRVVQFSGGVGSWAAAKRVAERYGTADIVLLFADVKDEDEDLYRFIREAAANVGAPLTVIADGRTPRQVMRDERFIGNSAMDPCSKILKRQMLDRWCKENCNPVETVRYIGIGWTEAHRLETFRKRVAPWTVEAPMCDEPNLTDADVRAWLEREGVRLPRLYELGFPHNNCGGACVKAGQGQWALLLKHKRPLYLEWEDWEEGMRAEIGDHSILRDRRGGQSKPLTLRNFRLSVDAKQKHDEHEFGGCGCAL